MKRKLFFLLGFKTNEENNNKYEKVFQLRISHIKSFYEKANINPFENAQAHANNSQFQSFIYVSNQLRYPIE